MSTLKRAKVVMLPTEKASNVWLNKFSNQLHLDGEFKENHKDAINQHLYIISDEEIKEGDWFVGFADGSIKPFVNQADKSTVEINNWQLNKKGHSSNKKIIATTDKSLTEKIEALGTGSTYVFNLPQSSQSFIKKFVEEYNKGNVITDVMVEYELCHGKNGYVPELKINPKDNTITIHKCKDSWSSEEMRQKLNDYRLYAKNTNLSIEMFDKWIEENL